MLEVKEVVKSFKSGDHTIKPVNGISFTIEEGHLRRHPGQERKRQKHAALAAGSPG